MVIDHEIRRRERRDAGVAPLHLENQSTGTAMEVVMVVLAPQLESVRLPRKLDRRNPTFLHPGANGPIDGGDAQSRTVELRLDQDLLWSQRPIGIRQDLPDRPLLSRAATRGLRLLVA